MRLRNLRFVAPLLLALALVAGCSGDDDPTASSSKNGSPTTDASDGDAADGEAAAGGTTTSTVANPKPPPPPDRTKYCAAWTRLMHVDDQPYDHGDPNAVKAHYTQVVAAARELEAVAPADVKTAVQIAIREAEKVAASGDTSTFRSDESRVNGARLQEYAEQHC